MSPAAVHKILAPDAIDRDDTTYLLRPDPAGQPPPELIDSVAAYGILQPPLLLERERGGAIILSGRRRIAAAVSLEMTRIPVLLLPPATPEGRRMELLLEHAQMGGGLSIIEQAIFLQKAEQSLSAEECLALLARLGHRPRMQRLHELISLLSLEDSVVMALHRQILHPKVGRKLARLHHDDQREIACRITRLRMGGSKQQKLIDLSVELAMRRRQPLNEIFAEMDNRDKEKKQRENIPQQASALLQWLHAQCFPRSDAAAAEFRRFCRTLDLPSGVCLRHTPAFEDDRLTLEIEFRDRRDLEKKWPQIRTALARKD